MSLIYDEFGRPYIIIRDQEQKSRLKGLDAQKVGLIAHAVLACFHCPSARSMRLMRTFLRYFDM